MKVQEVGNFFGEERKTGRIDMKLRATGARFDCSRLVMAVLLLGLSGLWDDL